MGSLLLGVPVVGALGPQIPTAGLLGFGGAFTAAQTATTLGVLSAIGGAGLTIAEGIASANAQEEQQKAANAQEALSLEERRLQRFEGLQQRLAAQRAQFGATGRAGTDPTLGALELGALRQEQRAVGVERAQADLAAALRTDNIRRLRRSRGPRIAAGALQGLQSAVGALNIER